MRDETFLFKILNTREEEEQIELFKNNSWNHKHPLSRVRQSCFEF